MKASEKQAKLKDLQDRAKDMQATYGYLALQAKTVAKDMEKLEALIEQGNREFQSVQQTRVEEEVSE